MALTKRLISIIFNELKGFGTNIRHLTLEKTLSNSMMTDFLPHYLNDLAIVKKNHEIVQNLKDGRNAHLLGHHKSKVVMAKGIVCTFASSQSIINGRGIVKMLGVDKRNIKKGAKRRILLHTQNKLHSN